VTKSAFNTGLPEVAADEHKLMIPQRTVRPFLPKPTRTVGLAEHPADITPPLLATLGLQRQPLKLIIHFYSAKSRGLMY